LPNDDVGAAILVHARTTPAVLIDQDLAPVTISEWLSAATQLDSGGPPHPMSWSLDYATVQFGEHLPDGRAIAQATATTYVPSGSAIADRNPEDNDASIWVHQVTDPPNPDPQPRPH
jgi:hypothetical protein